jgi:hypothetical protein
MIHNREIRRHESSPSFLNDPIHSSVHSGSVRLIAAVTLTAILCLYATTNTKSLPASVPDKSGAKANTERCWNGTDRGNR